MLSERQRYLAGEVTHAEYYTDLAEQCGVWFDADHPLVVRSLRALDEGSEHLNRVPLEVWDRQGFGLTQSHTVNGIFKANGDSVSLAGIVCLLKQAVRNTINEEVE